MSDDLTSTLAEAKRIANTLGFACILPRQDPGLHRVRGTGSRGVLGVLHPRPDHCSPRCPGTSHELVHG